MTSSSSLLSDSRITSMVLRPFTGFSAVFNPTKRKTSIPSAGADIEYFPSISVMVPVVAPFTCTETPGNGSPSDITVPETRFSCCTAACNDTDTTKARNATNRRRLILIFSCGLGFIYVRYLTSHSLVLFKIRNKI